ncbi:hypothetical protein CI109_102506 [Kwoniella shandongensis]|uniref:Uncharacterized protein n=1 Tax=Kwoniella shandongensis TaxID=1734106 RepID=A0AAJ8LJ49_9TREE
MKRSSSSIDSDIDIKPSPPSSPHSFSVAEDKKPDIPTTPSSKKSKSSPKAKTSPSGSSIGGMWTPEKREKFMDRIISIGLRNANMEELCIEFGMTKLQIRNATQVGRKGNFRDKACKAVKGEGQ